MTVVSPLPFPLSAQEVADEPRTPCLLRHPQASVGCRHGVEVNAILGPESQAPSLPSWSAGGGSGGEDLLQ